MRRKGRGRIHQRKHINGTFIYAGTMDTHTIYNGLAENAIYHFAII
jgi:hypothetical protein